MPGDKSISHRALIFNSLAKGQATVRNFLPAQDCLATLRCLRILGVNIDSQSDGGEESLVVRGAGLEALREPDDVLNAANSGTTMRLLAGLLAGRPFLSILTGDSSLRSRPMARIVEPLRRMGAHIYGREDGRLAPLVIIGGGLRAIDYQLPVASAQVKSALILAGLQADGVTAIHSPAQSRDHTERMLSAMGSEIELKGTTVMVSRLQRDLKPLDITIAGDVSSAAFWLVAGSIHPQAHLTVTGVGLNPTRTGVIEVLERMGAKLRVSNKRTEGGEPVGDITMESSDLRGIEVGGDIIPRVIDELPVIAVAAALASGKTVIRDAAELRVKETDRIAAVCRELSKFGAKVEEKPDGMVIEGVSKLIGTRCRSYGDHRLAMAWAVAGLVAQGETVVEGAQAVEVSYPTFWEHLERLASPSGGRTSPQEG